MEVPSCNVSEGWKVFQNKILITSANEQILQLCLIECVRLMLQAEYG
jgi:hypothetical protein